MNQAAEFLGNVSETRQLRAENQALQENAGRLSDSVTEYKATLSSAPIAVRALVHILPPEKENHEKCQAEIICLREQLRVKQGIVAIVEGPVIPCTSPEGKICLENNEI